MPDSTYKSLMILQYIIGFSRSIECLILAESEYSLVVAAAVYSKENMNGLRCVIIVMLVNIITLVEYWWWYESTQ